MRKNIKLEIIQAARKLFNERSYNEVSTQDIANVMGISKGNLNYHFKRKEDIIEAVVEEMHSHYVKPDPPATLEELNEHFLRVQKVAKENAFYFWHYTQLAQTSEKIRSIQSKVIKNNYVLFSEAFKRLNENGSFRDEQYPGQYKQLIQALMLICTHWTPHNKLIEGLEIKGDFLDCVWAVIYPLLTETGKIQFKVLKNTD